MPTRIPEPFAVREFGVDTSGRALRFSNVDHSAWDQVLEELSFTPTVVQGEWMEREPGGGATASQGYHDKRGCWDVRTWDLTIAQQNELIFVASKYGIQFWRRDLSAAHGGMDPHAHCIFIGAGIKDLAPGALLQYHAVQDGRDGLAGNGRDYEREHRKRPLVTKYHYVLEELEDLEQENAMDQQDFERINNIVARQLKPLKLAVVESRKDTRTLLKGLRAEITAISAEVDNAPADVRAAVQTLFGPRLRSIDEQLAAALPDDEETP